MNSSSTVSAELGVRLAVPEYTFVPRVAHLFYSCEDPYAIRIAFHLGLGEPVEWAFARELLAPGIEGLQGLGNVTVWPSAGPEGGVPGSVLHIKLHSPFGQALVEAPAREITDFLRRTYQIVPPGEESDHLDLDAGLTGLLREAS